MNQQRIPRPKGLTELGHIKHKDNTPTNIDIFNRHLLRHYLNTGFTYCGVNYSLEQWSIVSQIPVEETMDAITEKGKDTFLQIDPQEQGDSLRALLGISLSGSLSDRSMAQQQLNVLLKAQDGAYKPFISGEVNKALKLMMESTQGILSVAKSLQGPGGSVTINNGPHIENQQNNYLTTEKALEIIDTKASEGSILQSPERKQLLYEQHQLSTMPVVKANEQKGLDTSKEGLNFNKMVQLSDTKVDQQGPIGHIDRRAQELEIDLDQDEV